VSIISVALPAFVLEVRKVTQNGSTPSDPGGWPLLEPDAAGAAWQVTRSTGALATARFWQMLLDAKTYGR
jgi:hypothetical protein